MLPLPTEPTKETEVSYSLSKLYIIVCAVFHYVSMLKDHLSAFNQEAHHIFCLTDHTFWAMCHLHHMDPFCMFFHIVRNLD